MKVYHLSKKISNRKTFAFICPVISLAYVKVVNSVRRSSSKGRVTTSEKGTEVGIELGIRYKVQ